MHSDFFAARQEQLNLLVGAVAPTLTVELSRAQELGGVARSTWHHLRKEGRQPYPAHKRGNKLVVNVVDLAEFLACERLGLAAPPVGEAAPVAAGALPVEPDLDGVTGAPARGRPTRLEEQEAVRLGFPGVAEFRAAQRAKLAAVSGEVAP